MHITEAQMEHVRVGLTGLVTDYQRAIDGIEQQARDPAWRAQQKPGELAVLDAEIERCRHQRQPFSGAVRGRFGVDDGA